ncbi:MAG: adenylosuccinate lyase [bacterium]
MIERYALPKMREIWGLKNRYQRIVDVEIAVCKAQAELSNIPKDALEVIEKNARFSLERVAEIEKQTQHDVIALLTNLAENIGPASRYVHLGLTSYDVVDCALSLIMRESLDIIEVDINNLLSSLKERAFEYKDTIMIGRTHGIHAEPMTFGLKLALWYDETRRNLERIKNLKKTISVGKISGAVGTYGHISPEVEEIALRYLNLEPTRISSQIIQRDRHAEYLTTLAIIASSLDKFTVDIRSLQRTEISELQEPFSKGQKGSSAMPHKKNPVLCERISGLSRIIRSNAQAGLENMVLWDERDISHSSVERVILSSSSILLDFILCEFSRIISGLVVNPEKMLENLNKTGGLIFSEDLMLKMVDKGLSREEAYGIVQRIAHSQGVFYENVRRDEEINKVLSKDEIETPFEIKKSLSHLDYIFKKVFEF